MDPHGSPHYVAINDMSFTPTVQRRLDNTTWWVITDDRFNLSGTRVTYASPMHSMPSHTHDRGKFPGSAGCWNCWQCNQSMHRSAHNHWQNFTTSHSVTNFLQVPIARHIAKNLHSNMQSGQRHLFWSHRALYTHTVSCAWKWIFLHDSSQFV